MNGEKFHRVYKFIRFRVIRVGGGGARPKEVFGRILVYNRSHLLLSQFALDIFYITLQEKRLQDSILEYNRV